MNRGRGPRAIREFVAWQLGSRLVPGPVAVPFVNDSLLLVCPGMHGATQNIYCGLADFDDMSFLLHLLGAEDLFVDVGANVGCYTVLASAAIGARSVAFEPNPETLPGLMSNVQANDIGSLVEVKQAAAGARSGVLRFQADGTATRVASSESVDTAIFESPVVTLNESLAGVTPALIKIDVEGYESDVLAGADVVLNNSGLLALIVENNGDCVQFGFTSDHAHKMLLSYDFVAVHYSPRERKLEKLSRPDRLTQNSIYVRDLAAVRSRVASAPAFRAKGQTI